MIAILSLNACVTSELPLSKVRYYEPDYRLLGLWYNVNDWHTHEYLHITIDLNKYMHMIRVAHPVSNRGQHISVDEFYIFPTKLGTVQYMNVQIRTNSGAGSSASKQYIITKYAVYKDGLLRVWMLKPSALVKAIKHGYMKGKVWTKNGKQHVQLNVSSAQLRRWVLNASLSSEYNAPIIYKQLKKAVFREY